MTEGRQREGDQKAEPTGKVVRLPRDWLGPRDELVPFGRRSATPEAEPATPRLTPETSTLLADSPPTAADFWGERSAAIHDALQAPPEGQIVQVPAEGQVVVANGSDSDAADGDRAIPVHRRGRRPLVAALALTIAAIATASVAFGGFGLAASTSRTSGGPGLNIAAVVSDGVSRTLRSGLVRLHMSAGDRSAPATARHRAPGGHRAPSQLRARTPRRASRPRPVFEAAQENTHSSLSTTVQPVSVVRQPAPTVTATRSETTSQPIRTASPPAPSHPSHTSRATVSPTGESGALGPIQSPNG